MLEVGHFFGLRYNVTSDTSGSPFFVVITEDGERSAVFDATSHSEMSCSLYVKEKGIAKSFIGDFGEDFLADWEKAKAMINGRDNA